MTTSVEIVQVVGPTWRTPLTLVDAQTVGGARLAKMKYSPGYYALEGVHGREVYEVVRGSLPVTSLQRREGRGWKTWMVDDVVHWWGMGERVQEIVPDARVLCAGLGLGLMLHHLAASRPDVRSVTVVELDQDVIDLITPTLPEDPRVTIVRGDFYDYVQGSPEVDSVFWDLAVGSGPMVQIDFRKATAVCGAYLPDAQLIRFGERKTVRPSWIKENE